ncbi:alpha/beta fold hydrolase [Clostridium sp. UBA4548]|uniref:alpha/beta fold hydrolase n=1 Tax=Clostridium sp. UBA4548 TaxID=1946361 RepID=UPI0025C22CC5|nr:alpha/beta hydrolase [Clostridium sp. UBA4548]
MKRKNLSIILIIVILLVAVGVFGVMKHNKTLQASKTVNGKIDIGGYGLNVKVEGKGKPIVIFESGLGGGYSDWARVQPEIAKITRTFSYDRAGLGGSDKSKLQRTALNQVKELHGLLENCKAKGPYIIVAHSIGGLNARLFADVYPNEVAGIVFVDSSHEDMLNIFTSKAPEEYEAMKAQFSSPEGTFEDLLKSTDQVREVRKKDALRNIPIIVLSADKSAMEIQDPIINEWPKLQEDLATLSDKSKHLTIKNASHMLQNDNPQAVIDAIKEIIETVKE